MAWPFRHGFRGSGRLLLILLVLPCMGFEWPGRVHRLRYELEQAEPQRRAEVVRQLGQYTAAEVRDALLVALEDDEAAVRHEAAASAARVGLREAIPILLDWLDERDAETRRAAASALGRIGDPRSLPSLVRALGDSAANVRHAAVGAVARIGTAEAVAPLLGRLEDLDLSIRLEATHALGKLRDPRAVVPLLARARDADADVRTATLAALGEIGDARATASLTQALDDPVEQVRFAAVAALGQLRQVSAVPALKGAMQQPRPRLRRAILAALGQIGGEPAREALLDQLGTPALERAAMGALVVMARGLVAEQQAAAARAEEAPTTTTTAKATAAGEAEVEAPSGDALIEAVARRLGATVKPETERAVARSLARLAEVLPITVAIPALLERLAALHEDPVTGDQVAFALAASADPRVLMPLLERLGRAEGNQLDPVLLALETHTARIEPDGRAADPLMARLEGASPAQQARIAALLGTVGAPRALPTLRPLLESPEEVVRLSALRAMGELGSTEGSPALLPLIDSRDGRTRFEAAQALRSAADSQSVSALLERLRDPGDAPIDRHAHWIALGGALPRLESNKRLSDDQSTLALTLLERALDGEDQRLADRAIDALATWATEDGLKLIAAQLRSPSSRRRARAAAALAHFEHRETRVVLRYVLRHGKARVLSAAIGSLGEVGDQRDLAALMRQFERRHWPVPGAVSHAVTRMVARGAVKTYAARRALCAMASSREPYVRANVAAGLARLAARPCEDGPNPLSWMGEEHAPEVRAAAARWAHAAAQAGRMDAYAVRAALMRCATRDLERGVRAACTDPALPEGSESAQVYAYAPDGATLLRDRLVGVWLADGSVFLGYTDHNGHVRLPNAPRGRLGLVDPTQAPLEPAPRVQGKVAEGNGNGGAEKTTK